MDDRTFLRASDNRAPGRGFRRLQPQPPIATNAGDLADAGLPVIVLGPGEPYPAHTKDEWVSLTSIRQGAAVYESLMRTELSADA
ncbi:MAG: hypothetical protein WD768_13770 [Phycisphaeraceae bacterium]